MKKNRIVFMAETAGKDLLRRPFVNRIVFLVIFISLTASLCAGNVVWDLFETYRFAQVPNAGSIAVVDFFLKEIPGKSPELMSEEELKKAVLNGVAKPEDCGLSAYMNLIVERQEEVYSCITEGVDRKLLEYWKNQTAGQRSEVLFEEEKQCFITEGRGLYESGVTVGDTLVISGEEFTVAGVIRMSFAYGEVLLSYSDFAALTGEQHQQYQAVIGFDEYPRTSKLRSALTKHAEVMELRNGVEHQQAYLDSIIWLSAEKGLIAVITILFAVMNMYLLLKGSMRIEQHTYGIRLSFGASRHSLMCECLVKTALMVTLASLAGGGCYAGMLSSIPGMHRTLYWQVWLIIWLLFLVCCSLIYVGVMRWLLKKQSINWLLKEKV